MTVWRDELQVQFCRDLFNELPAETKAVVHRRYMYYYLFNAWESELEVWEYALDDLYNVESCEDTNGSTKKSNKTDK